MDMSDLCDFPEWLRRQGRDACQGCNVCLVDGDLEEVKRR